MASAVCPNGHPSATTDYCDVCGAPMGTPAALGPAASGAAAAGTAAPASGAPGAASADPPPAVPPATGSTPAATGSDPSPTAAAPAVACPNCGTDNPDGALFCENCGYDFTTGQTPLPDPVAEPAPAATVTGWEVEVTADADWYALKATGDTEPFPVDQPARTVALRSHVALIGRESASRGIHPDVDAGDDDAVSRRHAQLVHDGDGWKVVDLGSTNGTTLAPAGGAPEADPLPSGQPRPVADGDSVLVGAWTRITLRRLAPAAPDPAAPAPVG